MGKACSVPVILTLLGVLSCFFLVHGLYCLIELFGSPDLSPEATLLIFVAFTFLVLAAAAAGGSRRALLPREGAMGSLPESGGEQQAVPTTAEAVAMGGKELPLLLAGDEEMTARRVDLQTEDYPGSGANSRHDPRNPH